MRSTGVPYTSTEASPQPLYGHALLWHLACGIWHLALLHPLLFVHACPVEGHAFAPHCVLGVLICCVLFLPLFSDHNHAHASSFGIGAVLRLSSHEQAGGCVG